MKSKKQKIIKTNSNKSEVKAERIRKMKEWISKIKMSLFLSFIYSKSSGHNIKLIEGENIDEYFFDELPKNFTSFNMMSGEIALTTIGNLEHCFKIIWNFPKGIFKLEIGKKGKYDVVLITFKEKSQKILELPLYFTPIHPTEKSFTTMIKGSGSQLNVVDKEIWSQNKESIYSDDEKTFGNFLTKYEKLFPGQLILFEINNRNSVATTDNKNSKHEYTAFAGFNSDGEISYLLIKRLGNR